MNSLAEGQLFWSGLFSHIVVGCVRLLHWPQSQITRLRELRMVLMLRAGLLSIVEVRVLLDDIFQVDLGQLQVWSMPSLLHYLREVSLWLFGRSYSWVLSRTQRYHGLRDLIRATYRYWPNARGEVSWNIWCSFFRHRILGSRRGNLLLLILLAHGWQHHLSWTKNWANIVWVSLHQL